MRPRRGGIIRQIREPLPRLAAISAAEDVRDAVFDTTCGAPLLARHHRDDGDERAIIEPHEAGAFHVVFRIGIVKDDGVILRQRLAQNERAMKIARLAQATRSESGISSLLRRQRGLNAGCHMLREEGVALRP